MREGGGTPNTRMTIKEALKRYSAAIVHHKVTVIALKHTVAVQPNKRMYKQKRKNWFEIKIESFQRK